MGGWVVGKSDSKESPGLEVGSQNRSYTYQVPYRSFWVIILVPSLFCYGSLFGTSVFMNSMFLGPPGTGLNSKHF